MAGGNASRTTWILPSPVRINGKMLIYIAGMNSDEVSGLDSLAKPHQRNSGTYVAIAREAGLAALVPDGRGFGAQGEAITQPLLLPQRVSSLTLNLDCGGGGYVQLGLQHANGTEIAGFALQNSMFVAGISSTAATAYWLQHPARASDDANSTLHATHEVQTSDLSKLGYDRESGLRIHFFVKGCALYAFQFRESTSNIK